MRLLLLILPLILLCSCSRLFEPTYFGVKESVWNTLSEECKQKAIEGYNERKRRQQEIDAEMSRRQQEIDANNAPYEYALKIAETITDNQHPYRIKEMDAFWGRFTLNNGDTYQAEDSESVRHWSVGQDLVICKAGIGIYSYTVENLQTRERVKAKKR